MKGFLSIAILCFFLAQARAAAQEARIVRGPYLQSLLDTSAVVFWNTDIPTAGKVLFAPDGGPERFAEDPQPGTTHRVRLEGLSPGTAYRYWIFDGDRNLSFVWDRFRTSPPPGDEPIRAAVVGDSGSGNRYQYAVAAVIEDMAPDIFLHTGDLIYISDMDKAIFGAYRKTLASAGFFPARGNHADDFLDWESLFEFPGWSQDRSGYHYSFDWGSAHFVCLDTEADYGIGSAQLRWLESDLEAAAQKKLPWTILYFHRPVISVGGYANYLYDMPEIILPIADRYGVDLILNGHDHNYQRSHPVREGIVRDAWQDPVFSAPRGTICVVTGCGGATPYFENDEADHRFTRIFSMYPHAVEMEIAASRLTLRAISYEKAVLDSFTILKGVPPRDPEFIRGDANRSGSVNIADAVALLWYLFADGAPPECPAAADANASGGLNLTDPIHILQHLFLSGPPPAPPFPECGPAPGSDAWCLRAGCGE